jgi:transcriptional regulator with XRE-family HTH domain
MGFKENLKDELKFQDVTVKELAYKTEINKRTIDNYLRENESQPTVENAVKIAQALGVTVEYLVTGQNSTTAKEASQGQPPALDLKLCKKYYALFQKLDSLPDGIRVPLCRMIEELQ